MWKKKIACFLLMSGVFMLAAGVSMAQRGPEGGGKPPSPPSASEMVSQMKSTLNLTDAQAAQVTAIIEEEASQMEALMKSGNPESGRSQMESIRQSTQSKLSEVLTAEQMALFKSSKPKKPEGGGSQGGRGGRQDELGVGVWQRDLLNNAS